MRAILTVVLPIALPLLIYFAYQRFVRSKWRQTTASVWPAELDRALPWLLAIAATLIVAGFLAMRLTSGVAPGTKLEAPRLQDGKVVPSHRVE